MDTASMPCKIHCEHANSCKPTYRSTGSYLDCNRASILRLTDNRHHIRHHSQRVTQTLGNFVVMVRRTSSRKQNTARPCRLNSRARKTNVGMDGGLKTRSVRRSGANVCPEDSGSVKAKTAKSWSQTTPACIPHEASCRAGPCYPGVSSTQAPREYPV